MVDRARTAYEGTVSGHVYGNASGGRWLVDVATGGTVASYLVLTGDGLLVFGSADGRLFTVGSPQASTG